MIYSLNALRVIAEWVVVRLHLHAVLGKNSSVWYDIFAHDMLSFFFVLSGFVAARGERDESMDWAASWRYWFRRWTKTYPFYVLSVTVNLVGVFLHEPKTACGLFWPCVVGQYLAVSPWMFCDSVQILSVSWYLATLYWLWLAFPFIHTHGGALRRSPWVWGAGFYALSFVPWTVGVIYPWLAGGGVPTNNLSQMPLFRVCEFLVGYCAAFIKTGPTGPAAGLAVALYVAQFVMDVVVTSNYTECALVEGTPVCTLWGERGAPKHSCVPAWDQFWSRSAAVWALVIVFFARAEEAWTHVPFLGHAIWKDLSAFSLSMYLFHFSIGAILLSLARAVRLGDMWDIDTLCIACYALSYVLHRVFQWLFVKRNPPRGDILVTHSAVVMG